MLEFWIKIKLFFKEDKMREKILIIVADRHEKHQQEINKALEKFGDEYTIHSANTASSYSVGLVLTTTIVLKPKS